MCRNRKVISKAIVILVIAAVAFMLFPRRLEADDGGTVSYAGLVYEYTVYHSMNDSYPDGYMDGTSLELFGFEVFSNIE